LLDVLCWCSSNAGESPGPSGMLPFHEAGRTAMLSHFTQLSNVLTCAKLTNFPSPAHGAYAWVQCEGTGSCYDFFRQVNLTLEAGTGFGSTNQCKYVAPIQLGVYMTIQMLRENME